MADFTMLVTADDPLLFRDARPFSSGGDESRAVSQEVPPPTAIAGLVRTTIGNALGFTWSPADVERALTIVPRRYFFEVAAAGTVWPVAPAPASTVLVERDGQEALDDLVPRPAPTGSGCTLPAGLRPLLPVGPEKPLPGASWWRADTLEQWLRGELTELPTTVSPPLTEERVQIGTRAGSREAADGMLFTVGYRRWRSVVSAPGIEPVDARWQLRIEVSVPDQLCFPPTGRVDGYFGGERGPVVVSWAPSCTAPPATAAAGSCTIKLYLPTPALFSAGWRPGWMSDPSRIAPALAGARLVGAAVPRHLPVSGWSMERATGPKATWWAAPAGSVYFFELPRPLDSAGAAALPTVGINDTQFSNLPGFGQAAWGVWNEG